MAKDDRLCKYSRILNLIFQVLRDVTLDAIWKEVDWPIFIRLPCFVVCPNQERSRILLCFADLVEQHTDEIAALESWDNGKPHEQAAHIELPMVVRLFRYYAGG